MNKIFKSFWLFLLSPWQSTELELPRNIKKIFENIVHDVVYMRLSQE